MDADALFYERAVARMLRSVAVFAVAGTLGVLAWKGMFSGAAFALGAGASYLNFRWLHQMVEAIGPGGKRPRKRLAVFFASRYLLLGLGGYVIVKVFGLNLIAAVVGLLAPVAAVLAEILYELIYART